MYCLVLILLTDQFGYEFRVGNQCQQQSEDIQQGIFFIAVEILENSIKSATLLNENVLDVFAVIAQIDEC